MLETENLSHRWVLVNFCLFTHSFSEKNIFIQLMRCVFLFLLKVVGAIIFQPVNRALPLRCLEEKYGLSSSHRETLMAQERRNQKCLSLNITNGHTHDSTHNVGGTHCQDNGMGRDSQLRSALNSFYCYTLINQL